MGRPAKSASVSSGKMGAAEREARKNAENELRGGKDKIKPPKHLSREQKKIFTAITKELQEADILSNLDIYILSTCAIAIDRLQDIESRINRDKNLLTDRDFMSSKDKYAKDLYRCANELCLSPQSRAKLANIRVKREEDDDLMKVLRE